MLRCMHGRSQAYELCLPWRDAVVEGLHGLSPETRGPLSSGLQHGAGDRGSFHMSQVPLEVCFLVVMMREACFKGLDCETQNRRK